MRSRRGNPGGRGQGTGDACGQLSGPIGRSAGGMRWVVGRTRRTRRVVEAMDGRVGEAGRSVGEVRWARRARRVVEAMDGRGGLDGWECCASTCDFVQVLNKVRLTVSVSCVTQRTSPGAARAARPRASRCWCRSARAPPSLSGGYRGRREVEAPPPGGWGTGPVRPCRRVGEGGRPPGGPTPPSRVPAHPISGPNARTGRLDRPDRHARIDGEARQSPAERRNGCGWVCIAGNPQIGAERAGGWWALDDRARVSTHPGPSSEGRQRGPRPSGRRLAEWADASSSAGDDREVVRVQLPHRRPTGGALHRRIA